MQTISIEIEDKMISNIQNMGYTLDDIKAKMQDYLYEFIDDGYPSISYEEASKRVEESVKRYKEHPEEFIKMDENFWDDTEKRLIQRYNERNNASL